MKRSEKSPRRKGRLLAIYFAVTIVALVAMVASRAAYYALPLSPGVESELGELMRSYVLGFNGLMGTIPLQALAIFVLLLALAVRPRLFWTREEGEPRALRPWVYAAGGTFAVLNHHLFDADPLVAKLCWTGLGILALGTVPFGGRPPGLWRRRVALVGALLAFGATLAASPTRVVTVAILFWGVWLAGMARAAARFFRPRDALLLALLMVPVASFLVPSVLVLFAPGLREGNVVELEERGYAYGYCELPALGKLFMTIPMGRTGDLASLREGYVAVYDRDDLTQREEHYLFDDEFYGGLRMAFCLGDMVQITMNGAKIGDELVFANVLELDARDPSRFRTSIFGEAIRREQGMDLPGHDAAYDPVTDALFYVSEWTNVVFRLDVATGRIDTDVGEVLPPKELRPFAIFGLQTTPEAVHRIRRTLYLSEWLGGSSIYELHLDRLQLLRVLDPRDTGAFDVSVDEGNDRLIASGLWGINVFDLGTGEIVARHRTGPGARTAVIDPERDLIYVPTTYGGHIWVFDRENLEPLGRVTTGVGGRPAYLTLDGRFLFASAGSKTYRWDAEELGRRFGRSR